MRIEEFQFRTAVGFHSRNQRFQIWRIAFASNPDLKGTPVGGCFVAVDRVADC